jgi:hypothetical protein
MTDNHVYDAIRWMNFIGSLVILGMLIRARLKLGKVWSDRMLDLWRGLTMATFVFGWASVESVVQNNSGGPRIFLTSLALAFILTGLMKGQHGEYYREADSGCSSGLEEDLSNRMMASLSGAWRRQKGKHAGNYRD